MNIQTTTFEIAPSIAREAASALNRYGICGWYYERANLFCVDIDFDDPEETERGERLEREIQNCLIDAIGGDSFDIHYGYFDADNDRTFSKDE